LSGARRRSVILVTAVAVCGVAVCVGIAATRQVSDAAPVDHYVLDVDPAQYAAISSASSLASRDPLYRRWIPARFAAEGRVYDVEIALDREGERDRPVWTVHFQGSGPYRGMRDLTLALARGESDAGAVVAAERARKLGLLAAPNGFATLQINDSREGVVRWTEGHSNSMFMRLGYDKGAVYAVDADAVAAGRASKSVRRVEMARQPFAPSENAKRGAAARKLGRLIEMARQGSDAEFEAEIGQLLNVEKYIAWNALAWLFGSPSTDVGEAAQWYHDPVTGLFEPVLTDLGRHAVAISYASFADTHLSPIGTRLFRIPRYREKRNRALWALLSDPAFDVAEAADDRFAALLPQLAKTADVWPQVPRRRELVRRQREANAVLAHNADRLRRILAPAAIESDRGLALVGGFDGWNDPGRQSAGTGFVRAVATVRSADRWQMASQRGGLGAAYTRAVAGGLNDSPWSPAPSQPAWSNPKMDRSLRAAGLPFRVRGDELVLPAGSYRLSEDLIVPARFRLTLSPGVTLRLDGGVSILTFRGLTAEGTEAQPIRIERGERGKPWGAIGVVHASEVSRLDHVVVRGGSADRVQGIELSGQLAFNASDFELRNAEITDATGGEGVSVKRGSFDISRSRFVGNALDGLDVEWARGSVRESVFADNGDDGLDLAGSSVRVWDCTFSGMADKGVSAGEGSVARIADSRIEGSKIGVASKEGSLVELIRTEILDNHVGLSLYRDKPIFGAAFGRISGGHFSNNHRDIRIDPGSRVALRGVNNSFSAVFDELVRFFTLRPAFASAAQ